MSESSKANIPGLLRETQDGQIASEMVCYRCGLCCRYRVCLSFGETERIVNYTGLSRDEFVEKYEEQGFFEEGYEDMYWFEADSYLLRQRDGECFFLEHPGDKETRCRIHPVKPQVCQKYVPSPERAACQDGLATFWHLMVNSSGQLEGTEDNLKALRSFIESLA